MEYVQLGKNGLNVSVMGLGTAFRGGVSEEAPKVIRRALDLGVNFLDTGGYQRDGTYTEEIIGEVIKDRREDAVLGVKVYPPVLKNIEEHFKRLKVDFIDLCQVLPPRKVSPSISVTEAIRDAEELVIKGRVGYIGVSRFTLAQMKEAQEALRRSEIISNQVPYNLLTRAIEADLLPYCRLNKIAIIAYSPLAIGLLTGNMNTINRFKDSKYEQYMPKNLKRNMEVVKVLRKIGLRRGKSPAQVALNWIICKKGIIPIPGASKVSRLEENCGAAGWRLQESELMQIEEVVKDVNTPITLGL